MIIGIKSYSSSRIREVQIQFPIPNSQFPIPNIQFPIPNSQFPKTRIFVPHLNEKRYRF
ncbi:MAG: hypothetical protein F6K14_27945 [Symploca sp. SIO2C1]|nr:hypothetical protein [Symploca sp. SIO2C1]